MGFKRLPTGFSDAHICTFVYLPPLLENKAFNSLLFSRHHRQILHSLTKPWKVIRMNKVANLTRTWGWHSGDSRQPTPPSATQQSDDFTTMLKMIQWLPISLRIKPKLVPMTCKAYLVFFLLPVPFCLIPVFPLITIFQPHWFSFHFISFNMPNIFSPQNSYIYSSLCPECFLLGFHNPSISTLYLNHSLVVCGFSLLSLLFPPVHVLSSALIFSICLITTCHTHWDISSVKPGTILSIGYFSVLI